MIGDGISILVPYRANGKARIADWEWLSAYWAHELPGAEVIAGDDGKTPFSRSASINVAMRQATGDVLVNMDADQLVSPQVILLAAAEIRRRRQLNQRTWVILSPRVYRLRKRVTKRVLKQKQAFSSMPEINKFSVESTQGGQVTLCAYPREVLDVIPGMDEAFRGWGGEDYGWASALILLWSQPMPIAGYAYHLWHPVKGAGLFKKRARRDFKYLTWDDQDEASKGRVRHAAYEEALREKDVLAMTALANGAQLNDKTPGLYIPVRIRLGLRPLDKHFSISQNPPLI